MANSVTRINNSQDNKIYNVQQFGTFPVVVFGRTIKENSVPGTQYYFQDGKVKIWKEIPEGELDTGYEIVYYFGATTEEPESPSGACIFTVPDNFDFSKMTDENYVKQYCRSAKNLNANTVSPNYIIRNGEFICVKAFQFKYVDNSLHYKKYNILGSNNDSPLYYRIKRSYTSTRWYSKLDSPIRKYHRYKYNDTEINRQNWHNQFFIQPCGSRRMIGSIYTYCFRKFPSKDNKNNLSYWNYKLIK